MIDRKNSVFISRLQLIQNPRGTERLRVVLNHIVWDDRTEGVYIKKNSTAHSLCLLLGFEPYTNQIIEDGTYTREGKIK